MATASDIVEGAFRTAGILAANEPMSAEDLQEGLRILNNMMHSWASDSLSYTHTELSGTDTFPLADKLKQGVEAMLAVACQTPFSISLGADVVMAANKGKAQVSAAYWTDTKASFDGALQKMPSQNTDLVAST